MKKSIEHLKAIVKDGTRLVSKTRDPVTVKRYPNNIIKIHNRSVSWKTLLDILINGDYELETYPDFLKTASNTRGGHRFPGPGKRLGRSFVSDKKVPLTISIRQSVKQKLFELLETKGIDKNELFEDFINCTYEKGQTNECFPIKSRIAKVCKKARPQ